MFKILKKKYLIFIMLIIIPFLFFIGESSWVVLDVKNEVVDNSFLDIYVEPKKVTYNGLPQEIEIVFDSSIDENNLEYIYETDDSSDALAMVDGVPVNAGNYTVIVEYTDNGKTYQISTVEYVIEKLTVELVWKNGDAIGSITEIKETYDGQKYIPEILVNNIQKDKNGVANEVTVVVTDGEYIDASKYSDIGLSLEGTHKDNYCFGFDENLAEIDGSVDFEITARPVNITWDKKAEYIYGEISTYPSVTGLELAKAGSKSGLLAEHTNRSAGLTYYKFSNNKWEELSGAPTTVGSYKVVVSSINNGSSKDSNYTAGAGASVEFKIVPRELTVTWGSTELVYNGLNQGPAPSFDDEDATNNTGLLAADKETFTYTASYTYEDGSVSTDGPINANSYSGDTISGSYNVSLESANPNYVITGNASTDFTIARAPLKVIPAETHVTYGDEITIVMGVEFFTSNGQANVLFGSDTIGSVFVDFSSDINLDLYYYYCTNNNLKYSAGCDTDLTYSIRIENEFLKFASVQNYILSYEEGSLIVDKRGLIITGWSDSNGELITNGDHTYYSYEYSGPNAKFAPTPSYENVYSADEGKIDVVASNPQTNANAAYDDPKTLLENEKHYTAIPHPINVGNSDKAKNYFIVGVGAESEVTTLAEEEQGIPTYDFVITQYGLEIELVEPEQFGEIAAPSMVSLSKRSRLATRSTYTYKFYYNGKVQTPSARITDKVFEGDTNISVVVTAYSDSSMTNEVESKNVGTYYCKTTKFNSKNYAVIKEYSAVMEIVPTPIYLGVSSHEIIYGNVPTIVGNDIIYTITVYNPDTKSYFTETFDLKVQLLGEDTVETVYKGTPTHTYEWDINGDGIKDDVSNYILDVLYENNAIIAYESLIKLGRTDIVDLLEVPNYTLRYLDGDLIVNRRALTVSYTDPVGSLITKDVTASPAFSYIYNGLIQAPKVILGNVIEQDNGKVDAVTSGAGKNVNHYTLYVTGLNGDKWKNYYIEENQVLEQVYEITKAPLSVYAVDNTIIYGDLPTNNGVYFEGFVNGELPNSVFSGSWSLNAGIWQTTCDIFSYRYNNADVATKYLDVLFSGDTIVAYENLINLIKENFVFANGLENYEIVNLGSANLTVEQLELTFTVADINSASYVNKEYEYNGKTQIPALVPTNEVGTDKLEILYQVSYNSVIQNAVIDAKDGYVLKITGLQDEGGVTTRYKNYKFKDADVVKDYTFDIKPTKLLMTWGNLETTYNTFNQTPVNILTLNTYGSAPFARDNIKYIIEYNGEVVFNGDNYVKELINAGKYDLVVKFSGTTSNYILPTNVTNTLEIKQANIVISWNGFTSYVYTSENQAPTPVYVSGKLGQDVVNVTSKVYLGDNEVSVYKDVDEYYVIASVDNDNYKIYENYKFEYQITKATLTLTPEDYTLTYGDLDKEVKTYKYSGLQINDNINDVITSYTIYESYEQFDDIGDYVLKFDENLVHKNYKFVYKTGLLSVFAKPLDIEFTDPANATITEGVTNNPAFSYVYNSYQQYPQVNFIGVVNNDTVGALYESIDFIHVNINGSIYTLKVTGVNNKNYVLKEGITTTQNFVITPATLSIVAKDHTIIYGDEVTTNGYEIVGLIGNDKNEGVIKVTLTPDYIRWQDRGDGTFDIKVSASGNNVNTNYKIGTQVGVLTVKPRPVDVVFGSDVEFEYNSKIQYPEISFKDIIGATFSESLLVPTITGIGENAGQYTMLVSNVTNNNYVLNSADSIIYEIKKKELSVSWTFDANYATDGTYKVVYTGYNMAPIAGLYRGEIASEDGIYDDVVVNIRIYHDDVVVNDYYNRGSYIAEAYLTGEHSANYYIKNDHKTLAYEITKAPLVVTAFVRVQYGDEIDPNKIELAFSGFLRNDNESCLDLSNIKYDYSSYTTSTDVNYSNSVIVVYKNYIVITGIESDNYFITLDLNNPVETDKSYGNVYVSPRIVTISYSKEDHIYNGESYGPTIKITNIVNNDDVSLIVENETNVNAGKYTAVVKGLEGIDKSNYLLPSDEELLKYDYEIDQAIITYEENNKDLFEYAGYHFAMFTNFGGFVGTDSESNILIFDDNSNKNAGSYEAVVTIKDPSGNYCFGYDENSNPIYKLTKTYTITKKPLTVTVKDGIAIEYGKAPANFDKKDSLIFDGLVSGEKPEEVFYGITNYTSYYDYDDSLFSYKTNDILDVLYHESGMIIPYEDYISVSLSFRNHPNYEITYVKGDLMVNPKEVDITYSDPTNSTITPGEVEFSYVYNGGNQRPDAKIEGLVTRNGVLDTVSLEYRGVGIDVNEYTLRPELTGTHAGNYYISVTTETKKYSITKKPLNINWPKLDLTYDALDHMPTKSTLTLTENYDRDFIEYTITVTLNSINVYEVINAGTYKITITINGSGIRNYEVTDELTKDLVIDKQIINYTNNYNNDWTYKADYYTVFSDFVNFKGLDNEQLITFENNKVINADEYTATATLSNTGNYYFGKDANNNLIYKLSQEFIIKQKIVTYVTNYTEDLTNWVYKAEDYEVFTDIKGICDADINKDIIQLTNNSNTNTGNYTAIIKIIDGNYRFYSQDSYYIDEVAYEIKQKEVVLTWTLSGNKAGSNATPFVYYDTKNHTPTVEADAETLKLFAKDSSQILKYLGEYEVSTNTAIDAKEYTITAVISGLAKDNYIITINEEYTYQIKATPITISPVVTDITYGEEPKVLGNQYSIEAGYVSSEAYLAEKAPFGLADFEVTYQYKSKTTDTIYSKTGEDKLILPADTYIVLITVTPNDNFEITEVDTVQFTVNKKKLTLTWTDTTVTYNAEAQHPNVTISGEIVSGDATIQTFKYTKDGNTVDVIVSSNKYGATDVGKYTIQAICPNDNYYFSNPETTFNINKFKLKVTWSETNRLIYNGYLQTPEYDIIPYIQGLNSPTTLVKDTDYSLVGGTNASSSSQTATITLINVNYEIVEGNTCNYWIMAKSVDVIWSGHTQDGIIYLGYVVGGVKPSASYTNVYGQTVQLKSNEISNYLTDGVSVGNQTAIATSADANYIFTSATESCDYIIASCYYGNTYFVRVEDALYAAKKSATADDIYIIVGSNPIIDGTYIKYINSISPNEKIELASNDRLLLPFEGNSYEITDINGETPYAYNDPATYRKTNVIIDDNITLYIYGKLYIGGIISGGNGLATYSGQTAGNYTQITINANAKIICMDDNLDDSYTPYIQADGFIVSTTDTSQFIMKNGSIRVPFIIREHRGGSAFLEIAGGKTGVITNHLGDILAGRRFSIDLVASAFNRFFMPNVVGNMIIEYNASVIGRANMFANSQNNRTDIKVIGNTNEYLIAMNSSKYSYVHANYDDDTMIMDLNLFGGAKINNLSLNLDISYAGYNIFCELNTKSVLFPISWQYHITLSRNINENQTNASYSTSQDIKLLPGAKLLINEGASLTIDDIAIYNDYDEQTIASNYIVNGNQIACVYLHNVYPTKYQYGELKDEVIPAGELIVNGNLTVNNSIGGMVKTGNTGAKLNVLGTNTISSKEVISVADGAKFHTYTFTFQYYKYETEEKTNGASGNYTSINGYWILDENVNSFKIKYVTNNNDNIANFEFIDVNDTYALTSENLPELTKEFFNFGGWYLDEACTTPVGESISSGETTLYAKWTPIADKYKLVYEANNYVETELTGTINLPASEYINYNGVYSLTSATNTNENLNFNGWYLSKNDDVYYNQIGSSITGSELLKYLNASTNEIIVYGYWTEKSDTDVTLNFAYANDSGKEISLPTSITGSIEEINSKLTELINNSFKVNDYKLDKLYYFYDLYEDSSKTINFTDIETLFAENSEKTIYIYYSQKNTLTINYTDTSGNKSLTKYYIPNKSTEYTLPAFTIKSGYIHMGWKINGTTDGNDLYQEAKINLNDATLIEAIVLKKITVISSTDAYAKGSIKITGYYSSDDTNYTKETDKSIDYDFNASGTFYVLETTKLSVTISLASNGEDGSVTINDTKTTEITVGTSDVTIKIEASEKTTPCLIAGTMITMSDGSLKKVENIVAGDQVLVFNHHTGQYDISTIIYNVHDYMEWNYYYVNNLVFSDGTILRIHSDHYLFDMTLNKYVLINEETVNNYIGHKFYSTSYDGVSYIDNGITLIDSYITYEYTGIYGPISALHLNTFAEGLLNIAGDNDPFINIFEYDENMKYDEELKQQDIEEYGLFTYDDFKDYISEDIYYAYQGQYLKVAIGKGYTTFDRIIELINRYLVDDGYGDYESQ